MDYKEEIIDHYKYPRNQGELDDPKITIAEDNSSCGDRVEIYIRLGQNRKIEIVKWQGTGCAISTAAASMLSEKVIGMDKKDLEEFGMDGVIGLLGGEINAGRMKCASLAYRALLRVFS